MQASLAVLAGIAVAVVLLAATRRRGDASGESTSRSASTGWLAIALGLAAMAALFMAMKEIFDPGYLVSIVCAFASVALGIGALRRQERSWQAWVGLAMGMVPALFWVAFALGNVFGIGE